MNRRRIDGRTFGLRFARPTRVEREFADFHNTGAWVSVREELGRDGPAGLVIPDRKNAVFGTVLDAGPAATAAGVAPGDRIIYEEWQGGRWSFRDRCAEGGELRCLIMGIESVLCIVREE